MLCSLLSILFIIATAWVDRDTLEWSYIYSHLSRSFQRAVFFTALSLYSWTGAIGGVLLFMALFDGILNLMRGKDLFYLGTTAYWDKFFNDRLYLYIIVKVVTLAAGLYLCLC